MLSDRPEYGRTFHSVMWIVGFLAAVQVFAVGWAVMKREPARNPGLEDPVRSSSSALSVPTLPPDRNVVPRDAGSDIGIESRVGPGEGVGEPTESPVLSEGNVPRTDAGPSRPFLSEPTFIGPSDAGRSLSEELAEAASTAPPIEEPILERLVSTGEELRANGNMQGALQALREAESALPDHPRVMAELAATLSQMGLDNKADAYWERIRALGSGRAGAYYRLAEQRLKGEAAPPDGSTGQIMGIKEVKVNEHPPGDEGQKVALRVVIEADTEARPTGQDLALLVYFYDRVDGEKVDASTADTSYLYPTEPYDWTADGTEEIVVNYHQPVFSEEQKRELGERRYYGYAIELYYRDELQDRVTLPQDIVELRESVQPQEPPAESVPFGPENALFPESLSP
ncbi:MAG: hypothetical protein WD342_14760 [Verrucomicrobiales bacterium]